MLYEIKICVVGEGPEMDNLNYLVKKLKLTHNIEFVGWSDNISELLQKSKIFVLTSSEEGLPLAMIEAMSSSVATKSISLPPGKNQGRMDLIHQHKSARI